MQVNICLDAWAKLEAYLIMNYTVRQPGMKISSFFICNIARKVYTCSLSSTHDCVQQRDTIQLIAIYCFYDCPLKHEIILFLF